MRNGVIATGVLGTLTFGAVDASVLNERPLERIETVADYRIEARQTENRVETTFPWKDQDGFKVSYDMGTPTLQERIRDKRKREVITETVDFGDGGFKIDILLNEKPDTNAFCYDIEGAENYDFFYQPPLTQEEIEDGAERPEDIVGSYAVYHKTLKNHRAGSENYATGKVMHIPRPQVWEVGDEENTKEWAELSYDNGTLCVTARQAFLDNASYPVRIDPTFGYTSVGASSGQLAFSSMGEPRGLALGTQATGSEAGTLSAIDIYLSAASGGSITLHGGLYLEGANPHTRIESRTLASVSTTGWKTVTGFSASVTAATEYILFTAHSNRTSSPVMNVAADTGQPSGSGYISPTPFVTSGLSDPQNGSASTNIYSIYATYTASGGGATPVQDIIWFQ